MTERNHNTFVWTKTKGVDEWRAKCFIGELRIIYSSLIRGWLCYIGSEQQGFAPASEGDAKEILMGIARQRLDALRQQESRKLHTKLCEPS